MITIILDDLSVLPMAEHFAVAISIFHADSVDSIDSVDPVDPIDSVDYVDSVDSVQIP